MKDKEREAPGESNDATESREHGGSMIRINIRVFGHLKRYCGHPGEEERRIDLSGPPTAGGLLSFLGIPEEEELLLYINQKTRTERELVLHDGDTVWVYPFLCGG